MINISTTARRATAGLAAAAVAGAITAGLFGPTAAYAAGAPGDNFAAPTFLGGAHGGIRLTNVEATAEPGEPSHAKTPTGAPDKPDHSIWYRWVAPTSGRVVFRTRDSSIDTVMAAYSGSTLSTLKQLASNDDTTFAHPASATRSQIAFTATKGTAYSIAVDSFTPAGGDGEQGRIRLTWDANDDLGAPIALPTSATTKLLTFGSNEGASRQTGEPVHFEARAIQKGSIWYSWKAPKDGTVSFSLLNTAYQATMAAYSGSSFATLKQLDQAAVGDPFTQGRMTFAAKSGTTYLIAVAGFGSDGVGEATLQYGF